jgi:iron complex outermembrane recepter protein
MEMTFRASVVRRGALLSASVMALAMMGAPVLAQTAPDTGNTGAGTGGSQSIAPPVAGTSTPADQSAAAGPGEVVITGSRITSAGFNAPTPTQILSADAIAKNAEPNVFNTIIQLPSLQGSTGATTNTFSTSSGQQGLSSFSLRGLGTIRTLTLLDGQRVVPANVTGVPDISLFPQLLIERVDVVTGGASASYGSDAIGGVVNFITNKKFEGFKANVSGGVTTYGDDKQYLVQVAAGHSFLDGRLHVEVSAEYDHEQGVPAGGFGEDAPGSRDWYNTATLVNRGITNDGKPQYLSVQHAQAYQYTLYGLINNGPLQGTAFDASGRPFKFQYGSNGVPTGTGTVTGCYAQGGFCVGGDTSGNVGIGTSLQSRLQRMDGYGRIGFDLDADNEIYATFNAARVKTSNQPNPGSQIPNLTIQCANPFVPALVQAACAANNVTSFGFGLSNAILPNITVHPTRTQYRGVVGADGSFKIGSSDWHYDAYYEHGENITNLHVRDILLTPRYKKAVDATTLNGQIVCADPVARANGCEPINVFGNNAPSAAALSYFEPANGPFQHSRQKQDVASLSFSGEPFSLWAGPVSVAFGGEYRREWYRVVSDPYGNGNLPETPVSADYPADPALDLKLGNNWYAGNYHSGHGQYHVTEAFLEVNVPFLDSDVLGKANLNAAGRWEDYSTSGTVWTWKVGGTWETPIQGVRLRGVTSRDIRAPNLSELFAAPTTTTQPNFTNPFPDGNPKSTTIIQSTLGNPNLRPEVARNTEAGIVLSRPNWLPGFNLSVDYYHIKIKGVISTLSAAQQVQFCSENLTQFCGSFNLFPAGGGIGFVNVQAFNLASIKTSGFDIEGSYQWNLSGINLPGRFTLRGLATNVRHFITDPGIPRTFPVDSAGQNSGATPKWKLLGVEAWDTDKFSLSLQQRWFSNGTIGGTTTQYIQCSTACPTSTSQFPTVDNARMKGAFYFDVGGSYNVTSKLTAYFKVDNLFNRDPEPSPQTNTGLDVNPALYDLLGRFYRAGVRYNF